MTSNSTEFQEGDLVEAVKGEERHIARIQKADGTPLLIIGSGGSGIRWFRENGFTLTLIERPKPKVELPTERGWYIGNDELAENPHFLMFIDASGGTFRPSATTLGGLEKIGDVGRFGPFTRLESRADTAKAIVAEVEKRCEALPFGTLSAMTVLHGVASEFGASE